MVQRKILENIGIGSVKTCLLFNLIRFIILFKVDAIIKNKHLLDVFNEIQDDSFTNVN